MPRASTTAVVTDGASASAFFECKQTRQTRNTGTIKVPAKYLPKVLLADIGLTQQSRVPFSKVAPRSCTIPKGVTSSFRRNAERACKSDVNYSPPQDKEESRASGSVPTPPAVPRVKVKRSFNISYGRSRNNKRRVRSPEPEPERCQFCDKPFTDLESAKKHESSCMQRKGSSTSALQIENKQENFMSFLGLRHKDDVPTPRKVYAIPVPEVEVVASAVGPAEAEAIPVNERKARSRRQAVSSFFRKNVAVPISSQRGMQEILKMNAGLCVNPAEMVAQYEKDCPTRKSKSRFSFKESNKVWPVSTSKKMKFNKDEHIHEYSFTRKESVQKLTESAIELPLRYMKKLNRMKNPCMKLKRLSPKAIAKAVSRPTYTFMNRGRRVTLKKCSVKLIDLKHTAKGQEMLSKCKLQNSSSPAAELNLSVSTQTAPNQNKKRRRLI